jgi:hypothetical protein
MAFTRATERAHRGRMMHLSQHLQRTTEVLNWLDQIEQDVQAHVCPDPAPYVVSSLFLYECHRELTADSFEQFFFVTGPELPNALVLNQKAIFAHDKRNLVKAVGNPGATHALLIKLEQFGHRLLGHFHSHPGNGASATTPSVTDTNFQRRLETAGYPTVAAIFSRDGFLRFFRLDRPVEVRIHGTRVEAIGDGVYRLADLR